MCPSPSPPTGPTQGGPDEFPTASAGYCRVSVDFQLGQLFGSKDFAPRYGKSTGDAGCLWKKVRGNH